MSSYPITDDARTIHGLRISSLLPSERRMWTLRYAEYYADAKARGDSSATAMWAGEIQKLVLRGALR